MAMNHWEQAIETHNTNHPEVDHDCTDIQACDPRRYPSTNILFTSPECTNHSLAKGQKRKHLEQMELFGKVDIDDKQERSRATMWDVPRFAEYHEYDLIVVENVVDAKRWRLWDSWLSTMQALGYKHKICYFNSMFFPPCPQSRDRIYVVFWKKGNKAPDLEHRPIAPCRKCGDKEAYQSFKPGGSTCKKYRTQYVYRCSECMNEVTPYYYCAFNIIDWEVPIVRIGDRHRPLAEKTMIRIQHGLDKYQGQEMIITSRYTSGIDSRVKAALASPIPTQPGDTSHFLVGQVQMHSDGHGGRIRGSDQVLRTQTTRQDGSILVPPSIIELRGTSKSRLSSRELGAVTAGGINHGVMIVRNNHNNKPIPADKPIGAQATAVQHGLLMGNYSPGWVRDLTGPSGTQTTSGLQSLITHEAWNSYLSYYYGNDTFSGIDESFNTVTTRDRAALTTMAPNIQDCYYRCLKSHEIQKAMAFASDYVVLGTAKERVK